MTLAFYIKLYLVTLAAFFVIDLAWLGLVARSFYSKYLGYLMRPSPNWTAAIIFYLIFILGLVVFVLVPGLQSGALGRTLLVAAFFGLVTYATYDLTNLATVRDWPLLITIVDLAWGMVLSTSVTAVAFLIGRAMLGNG